MNSRVLLSAGLILLSTAGATRADDWPQWRGPNRDGVWREAGVVERFDGPRIKLP